MFSPGQSKLVAIQVEQYLGIGLFGLRAGQVFFLAATHAECDCFAFLLIGQVPVGVKNGLLTGITFYGPE
jgi:hypothetical protein